MRILGALLLTLSLGSPGVATPGVATTSADLGRAADFQRTDLAGAAQSLAAYRGRVVLLNFWASWCAPCLIEMPRFSDWQKQWSSRGLQVLGISMDDSKDPVVRLLRQRPVTYPIIMGDTSLAKSYGGVYGLPTTFLIDTSGRIVARYRGEVDLDELQSRVTALLPSK